MTHPAEPLLIVGPVTWDLIGGRRVPGGAVAYAARVAAAFGIRAQVLVTAARDADLGPLHGHDVQVIESPATLTYEHQFASAVRTLVLRAATGRTIRPGDVPAGWPAPRTMILAPLLPDDIDLPAFVLDSSADEIAVLAQGLQRRVGPAGVVELIDEPAQALLEAADERVSVFLSAEEVASWDVSAMDRLVTAVKRLGLTHGRSGTTIHSGSDAIHVPAVPAETVDTTGAGDVYATAFILALRAGDVPPGASAGEAAGRLAAWYAAANVERSGAAPLPPLLEIHARLEQGVAPGARGGGAAS